MQSLFPEHIVIASADMACMIHKKLLKWRNLRHAPMRTAIMLIALTWLRQDIRC